VTTVPNDTTVRLNLTEEELTALHELIRTTPWLSSKRYRAERAVLAKVAAEVQRRGLTPPVKKEAQP
jgi:hypothetical protein